ncbi:hypothetical protein MN608_04355 [Microdochium nivale]|nr:hypothetical protein MN608_04355 [Microdochium nivale]
MQISPTLTMAMQTGLLQHQSQSSWAQNKPQVCSSPSSWLSDGARTRFDDFIRFISSPICFARRDDSGVLGSEVVRDNGAAIVDWLYVCGVLMDNMCQSDRELQERVVYKCCHVPSQESCAIVNMSLAQPLRSKVWEWR